MAVRTHVCVGGPMNGKVMSVLHGDRLKAVSKDGRGAEYKLEAIAGSSRVFHVWALVGLTGDEIIQILLGNFTNAHH